MPRIPSAIAAALAAVILLAGCGASTKTSHSNAAAQPPTGASEAGGGDVAAPAGAEPATSAAAGSAYSAPSAANAGAPLLKNRDVIYTADITVRADNIQQAVSSVESLADKEDGVVYAEQVDLASKDPTHKGIASATVTLKVPPDRLGGTLDAIGKLGVEVSRTENADDVTQKVVDVNARINAANASITRLEQLMTHTGDVSALLNVENQLAQRDADLESLEQQQKSLASQVSMATITAHLVAAPPVAPVVKAKSNHTPGFLRGLVGGWHAFTATVAGLATGVGAALPFLVVIAVLAIAFMFGRRRLRRARAAHERPQES